MTIDVLHLLPSLSLYGGTPRKIRDLILNSPRQHAIYCWAKWDAEDPSVDFENEFQKVGITVFPGKYGANLARHIREIARIIKEHDVKVVHGYFETGLLLTAMSKIFKKSIATAVSFVGFPSNGVSSLLCNFFAKYIDEFVYVSNYTSNTISVVEGL